MRISNPSKDIDDIIQERGLRLQDVIKVIPPKYKKPQEWRSWLCFFRVIASMALCLSLLLSLPLSWDQSLLWTLPSLLILWLIYGAVLLGFFLVGHECGHTSFSKYSWVNQIVGHLCMAPFFNGFHTWVLTHNHHHTRTQIRGEDVDWSSHLVTDEELAQMNWKDNFAIKLGYSIPFGIFFWIFWNAIQRGSRVRPMLRPNIYERNRTVLNRSNRLMILCTTSVYALFWVQTGFWGMILYHHIPISIASLLGGIMVSIGHANINSIWFEQKNWSPIRGQLVSTYDYRFPKWLEFLVLNINIHIPHHLCVRIPWYHLKKAASLLQKEFPDIYQNHNFRWKDMAWIVRAPTISYDPDSGMYQLQNSRT